MIDVFNNALFTPAPKILGKQLRPYSLAHHFALKALKNPVVLNEDWNRSDLLSAAWVCRMTFAEIRDKVFSNEPDVDEIQEWSKDMAEYDLGMWDQAHTAFIQYINAFSEVPEHMHEKKPKPLKHPWEFVVVVEICKNGLAKCAEDVWNMPCGLAHCYYSAIGETYGDDSLISEDEHKVFMEMRQAREVRENAG